MYIRGGGYRRPVLKCDGCLQSLPGLSERPDLPTLRLFSENSKRDVDLHKDMIRRTNCSRERAGDISGEVGHNQFKKGGFAIDRNPGKKVYRFS